MGFAPWEYRYWIRDKEGAFESFDKFLHRTEVCR